MIPGWEDPIEGGMATHSCSLAWKAPWTEEPGGLQSMCCKELDMTKVIKSTHTRDFYGINFYIPFHYDLLQCIVYFLCCQ